MATRHQEMQRIIRLYREQTPDMGVNMDDVVKFAVKMGWPLPKPADPYTILAKDFSRAARQEVKRDGKTGHPYRVNHAVPVNQGHLWYDIDKASRVPMLKSLVNRREQMVSDGVMLTRDADHWNAIHPNEDPIQIPMDFTQDIEWRKAGPQEKAS